MDHADVRDRPARARGQQRRRAAAARGAMGGGQNKLERFRPVPAPPVSAVIPGRRGWSGGWRGAKHLQVM